LKFNETCAEVKSITNTLITYESGTTYTKCNWMCASCSFDGEGSNPIGSKIWLSLLNECLDKRLFE
jgi:hypothetical protein